MVKSYVSCGSVEAEGCSELLWTACGPFEKGLSTCWSSIEANLLYTLTKRVFPMKIPLDKVRKGNDTTTTKGT